MLSEDVRIMLSLLLDIAEEAPRGDRISRLKGALSPGRHHVINICKIYYWSLSYRLCTDACGRGQPSAARKARLGLISIS